MSEKVRAVQPAGVRDYPPGEMLARQRMLRTIEEVFQRFGFDPLDTPALERRDVLTGNNPDFRMSIWNASRSGARIVTGEETALRFDLTVPLARYVAANLTDLKLPFRRYQRGQVWRGEKPQAGRFNEFMQFDADVVGSATPVADAEIVALMFETMKALGLKRFMIRINNRKILNGLPAYAGFPEDRITAVLRVLDKIDKIGPEGVRAQLSNPPVTDSDDDDELGLGLSKETVDRLMEFVAIRADDPDEVLVEVIKRFGSIPIAAEGERELCTIADALDALGVSRGHWRFDLSVSRGLEYYTGPVFETMLEDLPNIGSVFSGGRFDGLVSRFIDATLPATGASVGVDRLFYAMKELGLVRTDATGTQVLVTVMNPAYEPRYLAMVAELRAAGINTEYYVGEQRAFKAQMAYATAKAVPVVVIAGQNEVENDRVAIKDMLGRTQLGVDRCDMVSTIQAILSKK
ncbi:MAG: histidine--tRNA ligase [bacterium]|nr:histidine--tRNA ligase [bacterium]